MEGPLVAHWRNVGSVSLLAGFKRTAQQLWLSLAGSRRRCLAEASREIMLRGHEFLWRSSCLYSAVYDQQSRSKAT